MGNNKPQGLGGWLLLPALGLVLEIPRGVSFLIRGPLAHFKDGFWEQVTTPGSEAYHHLWAPFILNQIVGQIVTLILAGILIYLFFSKSHWFPLIFIIYVSVTTIFFALDRVLMYFIPAFIEFNLKSFVDEMTWVLITAIIWIPYMIVSDRVANTFVKPNKDDPVDA